MPHISKLNSEGRIIVQDAATQEPAWLARYPYELGLAGDGITDDTATLQGLVNNSATGEVYLPRGDYLIRCTTTAPALVLKNSTILFGDPTGGSRILVEFVSTNSTGVSGNTISSLAIADLTIEASAAAPSSGSSFLLYLKDVSDIILNRVKVTGFGNSATETSKHYCAWLDNVTNLRAQDCTFTKSSNVFGMQVINSSDHRWERCAWNDNGQDGLKLGGGIVSNNVDMRFTRCEFSRNGRGRLDFGFTDQNGNGIDVAGLERGTFDSCMSELNQATNMQIKTTDTGSLLDVVSDISFIGCISQNSIEGNGFGATDNSGTAGVPAVPPITRLSYTGCVANANGTAVTQPGSGFSFNACLNARIFNCAASSNTGPGLTMQARDVGTVAERTNRDNVGFQVVNFTAAGNQKDAGTPGNGYNYILRGRGHVFQNLVSSGVDAPDQSLTDESTFLANSRVRGILVDGEGTEFDYIREADGDTAPASGNWRLNLAGDTILVHDTDADAEARVAWFVESRQWDRMYIADDATGADWALYELTSVTDNAGYYAFGVTLIDSAGTIADTTRCKLSLPRMSEVLIDGTQLEWSFSGNDLRVTTISRDDKGSAVNHPELFTLSGAGTGTGFQNSRYSTH